MKPPVKALLIILTLAIGLPAMAWTGTFLYWHIRLSSAIRKLEAGVGRTSGDPSTWPPGIREASETIRTAGCRCLPYIVGAIDDSKDWEFLSWMSLLVSWHGASVPMDEGSGSKRAYVEFRKEDSPELRRRMVRLIQEWWREHGAGHHQWWRVWSSDCRDAR